MCTVMTIDKRSYSNKMRDRIWQDAATNSDGMSLLLIEDGQPLLHTRSMDAWAVLLLLDSIKWDRMFLHCRLATQGDVSLPNTHGWYTNGVYYMHNGYIADRLSDQYEVDSQVIGHWLRRGGVRNALDKLRSESYANVFLIDTEKWEYSVSRTTGGSLYTDGQGNYSTNAVGRIRQPVANQEQLTFDLPFAKPRTETKPVEGEASKGQDKDAEVKAGDVSPTSEAAKSDAIPELKKDEQPAFLMAETGTQPKAGGFLTQAQITAAEAKEKRKKGESAVVVKRVMQ